MAHKEILIGIKDIKLLLPVAGKICEEFESKCNVSLYTEKDGLVEALKSAGMVDVFIAEKELFPVNNELEGINDIILLDDISGYDNAIQTSRLDLKVVNKYSSLKEIINEIFDCSTFKRLLEKKGISTDIITVYSPIGGCGTTTVALGLSAVLTKNHKKVLYTNIGNLQNFGFKLKDHTPLLGGVEKLYRETDKDFFNNFKKYVREDVFAYIPPFSRSLDALDIKPEHVVQVIDKIKDTNYYDYIVIDSSSDLSSSTSEVMAKSDNIVIVTRDDEESKFKTTVFLRNIDSSDSSKFMLVRNFVDGDCNNEVGKKFRSGTIAVHPELNSSDIECISNLLDFQQLGVAFI